MSRKVGMSKNSLMVKMDIDEGRKLRIRKEF